MFRRPPYTLAIAAVLLHAADAGAQAPESAWVYPSPTGNLLYRMDNRGQRIADFSQCGYKGGTEPLPNVSALISTSRWVYVSPGSGDDRALVQAAIDEVEAMTPDSNGWRGVVFLNAGEYQITNTITIAASGVVLKGAGDSSTSGTRLRATRKAQYNLISVSGSGSRSTVSGTTHNLTQKLVPAGARTFEVDSTSGLAAGHTVIVKRPSTADWIADIDMDQLDYPWQEGSKNLEFDRTITHIAGNWITVDAPLPQTFESQYGGGQIWRYTWSGRIQQVGIEDLYGFSDYAGSTDEDHGWKFIQINNAQHAWVRNITAQYFGYAAVSVGGGAKWITVDDARCLDPVSIIDGGRRYSFNNEGAQLALFRNCYARKGRHDFVFGATVEGPNAFVHGDADTVYSDSGPHHRWSVGGLFDNIRVNGNELNFRNRGNSGTGHGWAGAYMAAWNCVADTFRVRNPPTARNWLVGSVGAIGSESGFSVGADPPGTYDQSGTSAQGVHPRSLYYAQLQQRLKWPGSVFRESWLGDVDQHYSTGGTGNSVNCDTSWLAQVEAMSAMPADTLFDYVEGNRYVAFTFDVDLDPGDTVVAASLTVGLRAIGSASTDSLWLDSTGDPTSFSSLGWTSIDTTGSTMCTTEIDPALLADGRLNAAIGDDCSVDFAVLHLQIQPAQPPLHTIALTPEADAYVRGGAYSTNNYGSATTLDIKDISDSDVHREAFLRWDLAGLTGKLVQAKVRLTCTATSQAGNEGIVSPVSSDTWGESTITYDNKPAAGRFFAQWLPVAGESAEFSVTPQVAEAMLGDRKLSLKVAAADAFGSLGNVSYASSEYATAADRPQLILAFENNAPFIADIPDQTVNEDAAAGPIPFTVGDDFTAATSLVVTAASSNTNLVPAGGIALGGSGANRTVAIAPAANQYGTATITLTVGDGVLTGTDTFVLTVLPVNDPPILTPFVAHETDEDTPFDPIAFTASDLETASTGLTVTVLSSNPSLVPASRIVVGLATNPWTSMDLGDVATAGSAVPGDVFTMAASGADIWDAADEGHFLYQPMTGDGEIVARVAALEPVDPWSKAGVMIRAGTAADAANFYMLVTASNGVSFQRRLTNGQVTVSSKVAGITAPCWIRLVKNGTNYTGFYATDNAGSRGPWLQVGPMIGIDLGGAPLLGLAGTSHRDGVLCTATFDRVSGPAGTGGNRSLAIHPAPDASGTATVSVVTSDGFLSVTQSFDLVVRPVNDPPALSPILARATAEDAAAGPIAFSVADAETADAGLAVTALSSNPALLPVSNIVVASTATPWTAVDLGTATAGSSLPGDAFSMSAGGADIWGTADAGHFLYQPMTGDGEVVARVAGLEPVDPWSKAGVMMRAGTAAGAANFYMLVSASNGVSFQRRLTDGQATVSTRITGITAPCWVRLVKNGTNYTGFYATDNAGSRGPWLQVGPTTGANLGPSPLRGLAGTSHRDGWLSRSTFDHVAGPVSGGNRAVTLAPAPNASGTATVSLVASDGALSTTQRFDLVVSPVNDAPVLAAVTNRTIGAGQTLAVTNAATDVDVPAQTLTFSLLIRPTGAVIGASSGILAWRPAVAQADSTNLFRVRVADNGAPAMAATQQFSVVVRPLAAATVAQPAVTDGRLLLTIAGDTGPDYTVEASTNLVDWIPIFTASSPAPPFGWTDTNAVNFLRRFYRVRLGP